MRPIEIDDPTLAQAVDLFRRARLAVVLTGAGYSTPSGIPDFRTPTSGLWAQSDPMEVASLTTFHRDPQRFFDWFRPLSQAIQNAAPNPAHTALAELERAGFVKAVITQNIDGLHQRAGSHNVLELHGSVRSLSCLKCAVHRPSEPFLPAYLAEGLLPRCPVCGTILKPDIVFFEEMLPEETWEQATQYCIDCDLLIVVGSSLEVTPASQLPLFALKNRTPVILVNRTPTLFDPHAKFVFRENLERVIPAMAAQLLNHE
jgi:NAD-dependent deacetylase